MKRGLGTATSMEVLERGPGTVTSRGDLVSYIGFDFLLKTCGIWVHLSLGQIVFEGKRAWNSNFNGGIGKRAWNKGFTGNILFGAVCQNILFCQNISPE